MSLRRRLRRRRLCRGRWLEMRAERDGRCCRVSAHVTGRVTYGTAHVRYGARFLRSRAQVRRSLWKTKERSSFWPPSQACWQASRHAAGSKATRTPPAVRAPRRRRPRRATVAFGRKRTVAGSTTEDRAARPTTTNTDDAVTRAVTAGDSAGRQRAHTEGPSSSARLRVALSSHVWSLERSLLWRRRQPENGSWLQ